jgi:large subunit ribosomal protein L20
MRALRYAYFDRRKKKSTFKQLWIKRINAGSRVLGLSYSTIVNKIKNKNIILNKKILSEIIINDKESFENLLKNKKNN